MSAEPTIFLVDDSLDVRESLVMFLGTCGLRVETFDCADRFLETVPVDVEGCLLLDISMPGMDGMQLQRELRARGFELPIIFVTGYGDIPLAVEAMKRGAVDFLQKPLDDGELLDCIYRALEANKQRRSELLQRRRYQAKIDALSPREIDVLHLLVTGDMTKIIADKLGISPRTAEIHRARVMHKMKCKTLAQLVYKVNTARGARDEGPDAETGG